MAIKKKTLTFPLIILAIIILGVVGYFVYKNYYPKAPVSNTDMSDWKVFNDAKDGISFKYPKDWNPGSIAEGSVLPMYVRNLQTTDDYVLVYLVKNTNIDNAISGDPIIMASVGEPKRNTITINGKQGIEVVGIHQVQDKTHTDYVLKDEKYIVTFFQNGNNVINVVLNSSYDSNLDVYNKILSTFKFTN